MNDSCTNVIHGPEHITQQQKVGLQLRIFHYSFRRINGNLQKANLEKNLQNGFVYIWCVSWFICSGTKLEFQA